MSFYLIVVLLSILGPLALSFEKNLRLYKRWKYLFPAIIITVIIFGAWDIVFTHIGCWEFNPKYISGIYIFKLPLEEYLFFIAIPYACTFSYYAIKFHFPKFRISLQWTKILTIILFVGSLVVAFGFRERTYTFVNFLVLAFIVFAGYIFLKDVLQYFFAIFPVLLIPFFIVNGILTGTGIDQEVFSYSPEVIIGFYLFTVPLEDMFYCFSLLFMTIGLTEFLESGIKKRIK